QGSGPCGIEREGFEEAVPVVREVILRLREVGQEGLVSVGDSQPIVLVPLDRWAQGLQDRLRAGAVFGRLGPRRSHSHVWPWVVVPGRHRMHGSLLNMLVLLGGRARGVLVLRFGGLLASEPVGHDQQGQGGQDGGTSAGAHIVRFSTLWYVSEPPGVSSCLSAGSSPA